MPPNMPHAIATRLTFRADGFELTGWLHRPAADHFPVVIGVHGLLSDAQSPKQRSLAESCQQAGIAYLRFDHRGCGQSQGQFAAVTSLAGRMADLEAAAATVRRLDGADGRIGLFGSSLGATVCIGAAHRLAPVAMVLYAGPLRSRAIAVSAVKAAPHLSGLRLDFDLTHLLAGLHDLLVVHGTADALVPPDDARLTYTLAQPPKHLWLQPGGDHPMSDPDHQQRFRQKALAWFQDAFAGRGARGPTASPA